MSVCDFAAFLRHVVSAGLGTVQLVLLGHWLQSRGYAFWSMGHCYSPHMVSDSVAVGDACRA